MQPSGPPASEDSSVAAFVRLTDLCAPRLHRIALALCGGDRDRAADLTQETLVRAFRAFASFNSRFALLSWLARIMRNIHCDMVRSGRARFEVASHELVDDRDEPYLDAPASGPDALEALERAEEAAWLAEELEAVDEAQRLVIILCDIEGMTYEEAAQIADVPVGTIRSRLSRGRERLRKRMLARMGLPGLKCRSM